MRRAIVPLAFLIALATGFVVDEVRLVALAPPAIDGDSPAAAANTAAVRRFYAAVDAALATGEVTALTELIAPDLVEHTVRPGVTPDRGGLLRYLQALHAAEPTLWLTVLDLTADGDRVIAFVRVDGASGMSLPGLPAVSGRVWGEYDIFRLDAGVIVEHWGDDAGLGLIAPLLSVDVPVELPATMMVEAGRRTYPSHAAYVQWASGPTILIVTAGRLTVEHDRLSTDAGTVIPANAARRPLPPGEDATLATGDALVLGRRSYYRTRNEGATPALVLTIWAGSPTAATGVIPAEAGGGPGATPPTAPTYETLAGGLPITLPAQLATVTIGRIALAPGDAAARHRVANVELAIVESGSLALAVEDGKGWARDTPDGPVRPVDSAVLAAGSGVLLDAGATADYRPAGTEPLQCLIVTIGPGAGGDGTKPAGHG